MNDVQNCYQVFVLFFQISFRAGKIPPFFSFHCFYLVVYGKYTHIYSIYCTYCTTYRHVCFLFWITSCLKTSWIWFEWKNKHRKVLFKEQWTCGKSLERWGERFCFCTWDWGSISGWNEETNSIVAVQRHANVTPLQKRHEKTFSIFSSVVYRLPVHLYTWSSATCTSSSVSVVMWTVFYRVTGGQIMLISEPRYCFLFHRTVSRCFSKSLTWRLTRACLFQHSNQSDPTWQRTLGPLAMYPGAAVEYYGY